MGKPSFLRVLLFKITNYPSYHEHSALRSYKPNIFGEVEAMSDWHPSAPISVLRGPCDGPSSAPSWWCRAAQGSQSLQPQPSACPQLPTHTGISWLDTSVYFGSALSFLNHAAFTCTGWMSAQKRLRTPPPHHWNSLCAAAGKRTLVSEGEL